jgi:hypothetical protein
MHTLKNARVMKISVSQDIVLNSNPFRKNKIQKREFGRGLVEDDKLK